MQTFNVGDKVNFRIKSYTRNVGDISGFGEVLSNKNQIIIIKSNTSITNHNITLFDLIDKTVFIKKV
jgi:hypothetical protein